MLPLLLLGAAGVGVAFAFTGEVPIVLSPAQVLGRIGEDWLALPIWTGLRGLLFSPGRSLFLYSPWLLLAIPGVYPALPTGAAVSWWPVFPILVVLLYAMKLGWHGGSWGPRYLLPVVPLLAVACAPALSWLLQRGQGGDSLAGLTLARSECDPGAGQGPRALPGDGAGVRRPRPPRWREPPGGRDYWLARGGPGLGRALQDPTPGGKGRGLGYLWGYPDASLLVETRERGASPSPSTLWTGTARGGASGSRSKTPGDAGVGPRRDFGDGLWASWDVTATPERPLRVALHQTGPGHGGGLPTPRSILGGGLRGEPAPGAGRGWTAADAAEGTGSGATGQRATSSSPGARSTWTSAPSRPTPRATSSSNVGDRPDPRIHVEIAEADVLDTPLLYALPFSPLWATPGCCWQTWSG